MSTIACEKFSLIAMSLLNDLTLGQYLPIESPVHRLDPRTKLCGTLIVMAALMLVKDLWIYGPIYVWMGLICFLAHLPFATVFKNIRAFGWLLAVTFSAHALFTPGMTLHFAGYQISWITHEGLQQGALFTARLTVIMTVAAILTIVGYSLNDTIVVFDRIREVRGKNPSLTPEMVNLSLNQTLSRTLLTSVTTLIVVVILYFGGGDGIHGFAYCLVLGVVVGTYSSIFVASPALLWMMDPDSAFNRLVGGISGTSGTPSRKRTAPQS